MGWWRRWNTRADILMIKTTIQNISIKYYPSTETRGRMIMTNKHSDDVDYKYRIVDGHKNDIGVKFNIKKQVFSYLRKVNRVFTVDWYGWEKI